MSIDIDSSIGVQVEDILGPQVIKVHIKIGDYVFTSVNAIEERDDYDRMIKELAKWKRTEGVSNE